VYRILLDPHLHTYTAMYRAYRRDVLDHIPTTSNGFSQIYPQLTNGEAAVRYARQAAETITQAQSKLPAQLQAIAAG